MSGTELGYAATARGTDFAGRIPLHRVAGTVAPQAYDIASLLIEHYPEGVYFEDKDSNTPMHLAAFTSNKAVVKCMVQNSQYQVLCRNLCCLLAFGLMSSIDLARVSSYAVGLRAR
eukprot:1238534-Rhodomonas_salina.3